MEEIRDVRNHQYSRLQHSFDLKVKPKFTLQNNGTASKFSNSLERATNEKTGYFPEHGTLGRTCKVSLVTLKRVGSAISFTPSRKSSVKSACSKTSGDSNKSQIRKNSGQFDGCTARVRKHSTGRTRKMSSNSSNHMIAEIYRELDQLKESEITSSSEDEDDDNNNICDREDLERQKRVEMYIKEHSHIYKKIHIDTAMESKPNDNDIDTDTNRRSSVGVETIGNRGNNSLNRRYVTNPGSNPVTPPKLVPGKLRFENVRKGSLTSDTDDGYFSSHTQITSNRLTKLFLDNNIGIPANDDFHVVPKPKEKHMHPKSSINPRLFHYLQVPEESSPSQFYRNEVSRGSINSMSSTISNSDSVPMNFIPGQTKPMPRQIRSNSLSLNFREKAKFCFKGITCQVDRSTPKTFKAMAHAGMLSISIIGPSEHKCSH